MANILLVEDNPQNARLTTKILSNVGHHVSVAETALDGLRRIKEDTPDLVLVDINLPDLDGKTLANRLRRIPEMRTVPVIAFSAHNSAQMQRLALAYGCDGFISKPIDVRQFPNQIATYLAAREAMLSRVAH